MVLEGSIAALISRVASEYISNLDISALSLSIFSGHLVLRNVELNLEALRRDFAAGIPIEFKRGFIREIRIRLPWLTLASDPIRIQVDQPAFSHMSHTPFPQISEFDSTPALNSGGHCRAGGGAERCGGERGRG